MKLSAMLLFLFATFALEIAQAQSSKLSVTPGKQVDVGSVVSDYVCDSLFVPAGPLPVLSGIGISSVATVLTSVLDGKNRTETADKASLQAREELKRSAKTQTWLPVEFEVFIGDLLVKDYSLLPDEETLEGRKAGDYLRVQTVFKRLVDALPKDQPYKFRLRFSQSTDTNMTALPGGIIIVDAGMLNKDESLIAAILAHEIAHITKRHKTKQIQGWIADTLSVAEVTKLLVKGKTGQYKVDTWLDKAQMLLSLFASFHTDQELEADACTPRLLKAAGFVPHVGVRTFQQWTLRAQLEELKATQGQAAVAETKDAAKVSPNNVARKTLVSDTTKSPQTPGRAGAAANPQKAPPQPDFQIFAQRHPTGLQRVEILNASLKYWSDRDATTASALAVPMPADPNKNAAQPSTQGKGFFSQFENILKLSGDGAAPTKPADGDTGPPM
jgi:Zn-dependent protease with chaperone function